MSSRCAEPRVDGDAPLAARLEAYYRHYYDDALRIPGWRALVAVRVHDADYERGRLARLEDAFGRSVAGARVLTVGCGTGGFTAGAGRAGAEAWRLDASGEAAAIAGLRQPGPWISCARAEALPFRAASFDVVYCYSTLEHLADAARAVRERVRVLKPGGRLYVHTPSRWACFEGHYKVLWLPGLPRPLSAAGPPPRG